MTNWKELESRGFKGCAFVWPKIVQLRAELRTYENVHGFFEAMKIEAQRHLIELPIVGKKSCYEERMKKLSDKIKELSDDERKRLGRILETGDIIMRGDIRNEDKEKL